MNEKELDFFIKGAGKINRKQQAENPSPEWISDEGWDNITMLDKMTGFHGILESFEQYKKEWRNWYISKDPELEDLPGEWNKVLGEFKRYLVIRCLRIDRIEQCMLDYVEGKIGRKYTSAEDLDFKVIYTESVPYVPLLFLLTDNFDPYTYLKDLAKDKGINMGNKLKTISLGVGQAERALE